ELYFTYGQTKSFIMEKEDVIKPFIIHWTQSPDQDFTDDNRGWPKSKFRLYSEDTVDDTGIDDLDMIRVQIFPNPARDIVNIKSNIKITSINVYNYFGQKLIEKQLSGNEFQLNTSNLTTGIYLFLIETEKQTLSKRLVIGF
ncbi:MAG: T9SS type A sorting domain-containing protein, partial [Cyclobacteriaceae bacterium]|nr:T9SS type A sorting domain-containing protein [Cyclobacteriaceae bacterium]